MPRKKPAAAVKIPKTVSNKKNIQPQKVSTGLSPLAIEVISIFSLAFSVLLLLSIYTQDGAGAFGHFLSSLTKGLFGFGAYFIPLIIIFVSIYMLMAEKKYFSKEQTILGTVLFIVIISFVHVLNYNPYLQHEGVLDFISASYSSGNYKNGGLFGAFLGGFLMKIAGIVGAFIILIASGIALFILITGYSVIDFFKTAAKQASRPKMNVTQDPPDSKPMKVTSISSKKMTVYDAPENTAYKKRSKPLNIVVKDVEHSTNEEEIHIITGGKKFVKSSAEKKMNNTLKIKPILDTEIKSAMALENAIENAKSIFTNEEMTPKHEVYVKKPNNYGKLIKLNFDIADDETPEPKPIKEIQPEIIIEEEEQTYDPETIPDIEGYVDEYIDDDTDTPKYIPGTPSTEVEYVFPSIDFLKLNTSSGIAITSKAQVLENSKKLEDTLKSFSVEAKVIEVSVGPAVTRYELSPGQGVKVSKISGLADDLALNLAAAGIRIEAPIPGKAAVGIEVPNKEVQPVFLREVIESEDFIKFPSKVAFAIGKDIAGKTVVADIAKMPHLLIAGATGSGKSVCINTLITSIIYKSDPSEVKLLMVDPKVVELSVYNGVPHLLIPVVTDPKKAAAALNWAVKEMISRYNYFAETSVRDLKGYNNYLVENGQQPLPQIVIIVDELADLMMVAQNEVEDAICRLAQMARAAGLHLVIATQRPSVDVITGLIKANIPSRIAFSVTSGTDSRTILDMTGAEKLLGKGDMLFYPAGLSKPIRVQGAFISDKEVESIVSFLKNTSAPASYSEDMVEKITSAAKSDGKSIDDDQDELFAPAMDFIVKKEKASVSMLQRHLRIGYNRAARLMEEIEARGFVDEGDGSKPRNVLISPLDWDDYKERNRL